MQGLYLSVTTAKEQKDSDHDNAYGPGFMRINCSYQGADVITAVIPEAMVQEYVTNTLLLAGALAEGIETANADFDANSEKDGEYGRKRRIKTKP